MSKIILIALSAALMALAADEKPMKPLSDADAAKVLRVRNAAVRDSQKAQVSIQLYNAVQVEMRKKYEVPDNCQIDDQAQWVCAAPEPDPQAAKTGEADADAKQGK